MRITTHFPNVKVFAFILFAFLTSLAIKAQTTQSFVGQGSYSWTCPPGTTSIQVEAWGGGGAGGGTGATGGTVRTGGGGGGGAYSKATSVSVTPGNVYTITVGAGGTAVSAGNGGNGGATTFATNLVVANGGSGGGATNNGTGGTSGAGGVGGSFSGGSGAAGLGTTAGSGGGGSSAGTAANGNNGSVTAGGIAPAGGTAGAAGLSTNGAGNSAGGFGAGGSGSYAGTGSATARAGGSGSAGRVVLTYVGYCTPISSLSSTYLSNVKTNGAATNFDNTSAFTGSGYTNYFSTASASQAPGSSFTMSFTLAGGTAGVAVWIDWDKNNSFDTAERVYNSAVYLSNGITTTPSITVPAGQAAGDYVMRILTDFNAASPVSCSYSAVNTQGEAEDYKITVTSLAVCTTPASQPTSLVFGATTATSISGSFTAASPSPSKYLIVRSTSATAPTPSNGTVYAVASTALGTGTYILSNGTSTSFTDLGLTSNTQYYYHIFSYNDGCSGAPYYLVTSPLSASTYTCLSAPTSNSGTGVSNSGFTANWTALTGASSYLLDVSTVNTFASFVSGYNGLSVSGTSQAVSGLNPSTTYYYRVRAANATSCISTNSATVTVATLCAAVSSFPWTENFDSMSTLGASIVPICWSSALGSNAWSSSNAVAGTASPGPRSTANYMRLYFNNTTASDLFTPGFALVSGQSYDFTFYYRTSTTGANGGGFTGSLYVNTSQSPTGATALGTFVTATQNVGYTLYKYTYTPPATGTYYFDVRATSDAATATYYLAVDDFKLELAPACQVPVAPFGSSAITANSATVSWSAPTGVPAGGYEYYFSTTNVAPLSSASVVSGNVVSGTSASLTLPSPNQIYYWWVRSVCDAATPTTSTWASGGSFITACALPSAPSNVTFTAVSAIATTVNWVAPTAVPSAYTVFRSTSAIPPVLVNGTQYTVSQTAVVASLTNGSNTYFCVHNGAATSAAATSLASNTKYYYYVYSRNGTTGIAPDCSGAPWYSSTNLNGSQNTCAAAPTGVSVSAITSSGANFTWAAAVAGGGAATITSTINIYSNSGATTLVKSFPGVTSVYTLSDPLLLPSTPYWYQIVSSNGTCGTATATGTFTTAVAPCAAPTSLAASATVTPTGISTVSGSFTATGSTPAPTGYVVVRSTSASLPTLTTGTSYTVGANATVATNGYVEYVGTTAGSWTSTLLSGGTTYYYYVFSYNNTSCSAGPAYSATATQNNTTTTACSSFSAVISIGGNTTTVGSFYPTLTAAIGDLSSCGITQATTLSLNASYNSASEVFPIVIPTIAGSSLANTLTIKPASGTTQVISGAVASNPLIKINGASYVIIDGSNAAGGSTKDLSITNTSTTSPNVLLIGSPDTTPVNNVTLKNTIITNGANTGTAVYISSSITAGDPGYFNNITIQNNTVRKAFNGLFAIGNTAANNGNGLVITGNDFSGTGTNSIRQIGLLLQGIDGTSVVSNNTIANISSSTAAEYPTAIWLDANVNKASIYGNTISGITSSISGDGSAVGIYVVSGSTVSSMNIYNNAISGIASAGTYTDGSAGIEVGSATSNVNIYSNKISNVKNTNTSGYGAHGIYLGSTSTSANTVLYNNMIWDVAGYGISTLLRNGHGISVTAGAGYKIYYNSVNLTTNQTASAGTGAALYVDSAVTTANALDIRNNIFANNQTANTRYAFYSGAAKTVYSNINYNDYYSTGTLAYLGAAKTTLAALQATTGTGQDANSLNILPPFTSSTNLLIAASCTAMSNAGTPISGISNDIENEARSATTPDMGADEFAGNIPPKVTSAIGGSNCGTGTVAITATGSSTGSAITEYRLYTAATGGTAVATSSTGTITTPSISSTTTYYVGTFNGCESESRTAVTAIINPAPTDVVLSSSLYPISADECSLDYIKLDATGGFVTSYISSGSGTSTSVGDATGGTLGPNPLQNYYGGSKQQWIYRSSELTALGFVAGVKIKSIQLNLATADATYALLNLKVKMKNSATSAFATTSSWEGGLTTVRNAASYTPSVGTNTISLDTEFIWDGTSNIVLEINYSNNNAGTSGSTYTTAKYSATSYVSTIFYRVDSSPAATVDSYTGAANATYSARNDMSFGFTEQKIIWSPAEGLYTDAALTIPYVANTNASTLYAAPTTATSYTAKATQGSCEKSVMTATIQRLKKEFRGPGTDWNTASNWFPAQVPDNSKCAVIPATQTVVINTPNAVTKSLIIEGTGKTTITAGNTLTVIDAVNITNNAANDNLVMESDANLIQINTAANTGNMQAKRGTHMRKMDYTYWSSPVSGQKLLNDAGNGGFSVGTPNNRVFYYNEPTDTFKATAETTFTTGRGYAIRGKDGYLTTDPANNPVADEFKFTGVPHNGNITIPVQKSKNTGTNGVVEHGFNMIGNPYPSNIDFVKFFYLGNNSNVISAKAWFWTNVPGAPLSQEGSAYTPNNYATLTLTGGAPPTTVVSTTSPEADYTPTKNIKVGQGFIVQMKGAAPTGNTPTLGTLTFDNTIRNSETGIFYNNKTEEDQMNRYWVKLVSPNNVVSTILLAHITGATNNYDENYDADLLALGDDSFYSKLNTQRLQIQARNNPVSTDDIIPLGTKFSLNGNYTIRLGNKEGVFENNQKIYLYDKVNNKYTDLSAEDYIFNAIKGTDESRFEIVYKNKEILGADGGKISDFQVYRDGESFVVKSSRKLGTVELYDGGGKLVMVKNTSQKEYRLDVSTVISGIYIIKAENDGNVKTRKIIK